VYSQYIKDHFTGDVEALAAGQYDTWLQQPHSALAGIVLADQFTRWDCTCGSTKKVTGPTNARPDNSMFLKFETGVSVI
jgi:uncharacterized protein (DUF924 family)